VTFEIASAMAYDSGSITFMKSIILPAILFVSSLLPSFAITNAEITPTALLGKTLTFTIVNGKAPYATTGTWTGTFAASGNVFTAKNISGDFKDITTTYTAQPGDTYTSITLAKFVDGHTTTNLTLYTTNGIGGYEASIPNLFGTGLNGTFVFGTPIVKAPEIDVKIGATNLKDAVGKNTFGKVKVKKASTAKTITIKNTGKANLTGLAISKTGKDAADFVVTKLPKTSLAPGASISVKATFKPKVKGTKNAVIIVTSNDKDESKFDIKVTGVATK
jgi:hypothetical protein